MFVSSPHTECSFRILPVRQGFFQVIFCLLNMTVISPHRLYVSSLHLLTAIENTYGNLLGMDIKGTVVESARQLKSTVIKRAQQSKVR